jgi:peptide/nickel transport system permease protein
VLMAVRHRRISGVVLSAVSQIGVAVPAFLAGILLITLFAVRLRWLPANGWTAPAEDPVMFVRQLTLPALSLGLVQAAVLTRYVRSAVLDVLHEDYLRTARAKGLTPYRALLRHGLRNAAVPVVTVLGLQLATLLIGAVVVERVFVVPGLGSLLLDAVSTRDLIVVQDVVMLLVVAVLLVNFVVDVLYVLIDPRLRRAS